MTKETGVKALFAGAAIVLISVFAEANWRSWVNVDQSFFDALMFWIMVDHRGLLIGALTMLAGTYIWVAKPKATSDKQAKAD